MVELFLSSELSYQESVLQEDILHPALILKRVNNFQIVGPDALRQHKKANSI